MKVWALIDKRGKLRKYGFTDCLGMVAEQPAIWPTKRLAADMAIKGEMPTKIEITWRIQDKSRAGK